MATTTVWLPPGNWVDREFGTVRKVTSQTGLWLTKAWDLSEIPIFVRGGAVIPSIMPEKIAVSGNANRQYPGIVWSIYPGADYGSGDLYDDDGISMNYQQQVGTWSQLTFKRVTGLTKIVMSINTFFPGQVSRGYVIKLVNQLPPAFVIVNGTNYPFSVVNQPETWSFDPIDMAVLIHVPEFDISGWDFDNKNDTIITVVLRTPLVLQTSLVLVVPFNAPCSPRHCTIRFES